MEKAMSEEKVVNDVDLSKLVRVYLKMKAKRDEIAAEYKEKEGAIKSQMDLVKRALLDYCKDSGNDSVRTSEGLFYKSTRQSYWTSDWESMGKFIVEHGVPDLLDKRIHQSNMKQFLEENPDLLPPGLNVDKEYSITVRRK
jgi:hypothetical protein